MAITIRNKLEVLLGNKILVPGCEPTSAFTSPTLAENRECGASVVDLASALEAIPGSTIASLRNPRRLFFILPEGPSTRFGCTDTKCVEDYYQILRDLGQPLADDKPMRPLTVDKICEWFPLRGCF